MLADQLQRPEQRFTLSWSKHLAMTRQRKYRRIFINAHMITQSMLLAIWRVYRVISPKLKWQQWLMHWLQQTYGIGNVKIKENWEGTKAVLLAGQLWRLENRYMLSWRKPLVRKGPRKSKEFSTNVHVTIQMILLAIWRVCVVNSHKKKSQKWLMQSKKHTSPGNVKRNGKWEMMKGVLLADQLRMRERRSMLS